MTVTARAKWASTAKPGNQLAGPLELIVIHHSYRPSLPAAATEKQEIEALRGIDRYHRESQGWAGLGYSFCVFQSGRAYECRGWLRSGAHTEGENSRSHGICLIMDGSAEAPTAAAIAAIKALIAEGVRIGAVSPQYDVQPHDHYTVKVCPGKRVKAILDDLRPTGPRVLRLGDRGEDVRALQKRLGVKQTAYFGGLTHGAVVQFQKSRGLVADGIVGPKTRAALG